DLRIGRAEQQHRYLSGSAALHLDALRRRAHTEVRRRLHGGVVRLHALLAVDRRVQLQLARELPARDVHAVHAVVRRSSQSAVASVHFGLRAGLMAGLEATDAELRTSLRRRSPSETAAARSALRLGSQ